MHEQVHHAAQQSRKTWLAGLHAVVMLAVGILSNHVAINLPRWAVVTTLVILAVPVHVWIERARERMAGSYGQSQSPSAAMPPRTNRTLIVAVVAVIAAGVIGGMVGSAKSADTSSFTCDTRHIRPGYKGLIWVSVRPLADDHRRRDVTLRCGARQPF